VHVYRIELTFTCPLYITDFYASIDRPT